VSLLETAIPSVCSKQACYRLHLLNRASNKHAIGLQLPAIKLDQQLALKITRSYGIILFLSTVNFKKSRLAFPNDKMQNKDTRRVA